MFQGISIKSKKSSKKAQNRSSTKEKASLETVRGNELSESFSDRFDNLGIEASGEIITNDNSNSSECI